MSDTPKLRDMLNNITVITARTDERLQVVIDEQNTQKKDISTLKTQRSMIVGAYLALVGIVTAYFKFNK